MAARCTETVVTCPADCLSFLIFFFGFSVFLLQFGILLCAILSVVDPRVNTMGEIDNPSDSGPATFIPSNVSLLVRITQILSVLSYFLFADSSLLDVITAIETSPRYSKRKKTDNFPCMIFSCIVRFTQGIMTVFAAFLLIITSAEVMDILLNFMAMSFVSNIARMAFDLALWGKYGPTLEKEANEFKSRAMPKCMIRRKNNHKRYLKIVGIIFFTVFMLFTSMVFVQESDDFWSTKAMRVQFLESTGLESYSGCYSATDAPDFMNRKRKMFESSPLNSKAAKFGYCFGTREWVLFDSSNGENDPCGDKLAQSSSTIEFDIASSFDDPWFTIHGLPLDLYFFDDDDFEASCGSFLNDGKCDENFNSIDHHYDGGDCCASTCTKSDCGIGALKSAFGSDHIDGDGFPDCHDPTMVKITIVLDEIIDSYTHTDVWSDFNSSERPKVIEPVMLLDCDDVNVFTIPVNANMSGMNETFMIEDGANCTVGIKNSTASTIGSRELESPILYVNYTIFHGDKTAMEENPIVIVKGESEKNEFAIFERIQDCYFAKLSEYLDNTTMYTGTGPENRAIKWLRITSRTSKSSRCEDDYFLERYAMSVLNFAAPVVPPDPIEPTTVDGAEIAVDPINIPIDLSTDNSSLMITSTPPIERGVSSGISYEKLWISESRQCIWRNVECNGRSVDSLYLNSLHLSGTIPPSIGLLTKLRRFDGHSNDLKGTLPSELGLMTSLTRLDLEDNSLSGTIPSEIANLSDLEVLNLFGNSFTGSIPSQLAELANITEIFVGDGKKELDTESLTDSLLPLVHTICRPCPGSEVPIRVWDENATDEEAPQGRCKELLEEFYGKQQMISVFNCNELKEKCILCK